MTLDFSITFHLSLRTCGLKATASLYDTFALLFWFNSISPSFFQRDLRALPRYPKADDETCWRSTPSFSWIRQRTALLPRPVSATRFWLRVPFVRHRHPSLAPTGLLQLWSWHCGWPRPFCWAPALLLVSSPAARQPREPPAGRRRSARSRSST